MGARSASYKQGLRALPVDYSLCMLPPHSNTLYEPAVGPVVFPYPSAKIDEILAGAGRAGCDSLSTSFPFNPWGGRSVLLKMRGRCSRRRDGAWG